MNASYPKKSLNQLINLRKELETELSFPITFQHSVDRVITHTGLTYERQAINTYFDTPGGYICPNTKPPLTCNDLNENYDLKRPSNIVRELPHMPTEVH